MIPLVFVSSKENDKDAMRQRKCTYLTLATCVLLILTWPWRLGAPAPTTLASLSLLLHCDLLKKEFDNWDLLLLRRAKDTR